MVTAVKRTVTVQPGGVIEIQSDELPAGALAEVIVLLDAQTAHPRDLASFIGAAKGSFSSMEEADALIRNERDQWER